MKIINKTIFFFVIFFLLSLSNQIFAQMKDNSLITTVSDSVITARIKSQLLADNHTKAISINVETNDGIVKLTGVVGSELEAITAIQIAQSNIGVRQVDTENLHIKGKAQKTDDSINDAYITAKVRGVFMREEVLNRREFKINQVTIKTEDGVVFLGGIIPQQDQLQKIIHLAKSIEGVKKVVSSIIVSTTF